MRRYCVAIVLLVNLLAFGLLGFYFAAGRITDYREMGAQLERFGQLYTGLSSPQAARPHGQACHGQQVIPYYSQFVNRLEELNQTAQRYSINTESFRVAAPQQIFSSNDMHVLGKEINATYTGGFEDLAALIYCLDYNIFVEYMELARQYNNWQLNLSLTMVSRG